MSSMFRLVTVKKINIKKKINQTRTRPRIEIEIDENRAPLFIFFFFFDKEINTAVCGPFGKRAKFYGFSDPT